MEKNLT